MGFESVGHSVSSVQLVRNGEAPKEKRKGSGKDPSGSSMLPVRCVDVFSFDEQSHLKVPFSSLFLLTGIVPLSFSSCDLIGAHMTFLTSLALRWHQFAKYLPKPAHRSGLQGALSFICHLLPNPSITKPGC